MVEGARLEIWCGARPHLGFESLSLRKQALPVFSGDACFVLSDIVGFETKRKAKPPAEGLQRRRPEPDFRKAKANPYHSEKADITVRWYLLFL